MKPIKCPKCGRTSEDTFCHYCGEIFKVKKESKIQKSDIYKFYIFFSYYMNCIFFPPAKIMFVFWTYCWIGSITIYKGVVPPLNITTILIGYVLLCGLADLMYYNQKKKYIKYKIKITEKKIQRLENLMIMLNPMSYRKNDIVNISNNMFSLGSIIKKYKIGYNEAKRIEEKLYIDRLISNENEFGNRTLLCEEYKICEYIENNFGLKPTDVEMSANKQINYDNMDGHDFEYYCADILRKNGFCNVEVTQGSGDHGIDVLAEKDGISYAIQCKCYSSNIGNAAIQQAHTGKSLYRKDIAVVMTNRFFTQQAINEANELGVKLWDRTKLNEMIEKAK